MATACDSQLGLGTGALIGALLMVQAVGVPFTVAFGALARRIGARNGIMLALMVYSAIAVFGVAGQITGTGRAGILAVSVGFLPGTTLRRRIDVREGRRVGRAADAPLEPAPGG